MIRGVSTSRKNDFRDNSGRFFISRIPERRSLKDLSQDGPKNNPFTPPQAESTLLSLIECAQTPRLPQSIRPSTGICHPPSLDSQRQVRLRVTLSRPRRAPGGTTARHRTHVPGASPFECSQRASSRWPQSWCRQAMLRTQGPVPHRFLKKPNSNGTRKD
jgi:hypothetical protein